jgi:hypothetical protein
MAESRPNTRAADVFPGAAQSNPTIFYNRQGGARSVSDVYQTLIGRYSVARSSPVNNALAPPLVAVVKTVPQIQVQAQAQPQKPAPQAAVPQLAAFAPETAQLSDTYAQAMRPTPAAVLPENRPVFHSLFSVSGRETPVSPIVSSLWGSPPATATQPSKPTVLPEAPVLAAAESQPAPAPKPAPVKPPAQPSAAPLDLFQEGVTNARALFRGRV